MSAHLKIRPRAKLILSDRTVALRLHVERLEFSRRDAVSRHDYPQIQLIDNQIAQAGSDWAASFAVDHAESFRKTA
jgi:hypothetical protein